MRALRRAAIIVFPLLLAGCYTASDDGTTLTIKMPLGARALAVLLPLGLLAILFALCFLPKKRPTLRLVFRILAIIGIALTVFPVICCVPSFAMDSIEISPTEIHRKTGFWFAPNDQRVQWQDVAAFEMGPDPRNADRPFPARVWHARTKSGASIQISPGDLGDSAEAEVRAKIESLGIKVEYTPP
ncbi:MAG TPA: hypothetical protein VHM90_01465 [Phycisphaerae bacterium]|nr:hypothetical protein [Phycisphaerae bacterium]